MSIGMRLIWAILRLWLAHHIRYDRTKQGVVDYYIYKMSADDIIMPIHFLFASPVVLCRKKIRNRLS